MGRVRCWAAVVAAVVLGASGCANGTGDGATKQSSRGSWSAVVQQLSPVFPSTFAATRHWLVAFTGGDTDDLSQAPAYAAAPLSGGPAKALRPPPGPGFSPVTLVATDRVAVVIGQRCAGPVPPHPSTEAERFCTDGPPAAFWVDPATSRSAWVDVDPQLEALAGLALTSPQRGDRGWLVAGMRYLGEPAFEVRPAETALVDVSPRRLRLVRNWAGSGTSCVSDTAAYMLVQQLPSNGFALPADAVVPYSVQQVPLDGGPPVDLAPSGLPTAPGPPPVLGCRPDGPMVAQVETAGPATAPGVPLPVRPTAVQWVDGTWRTRPDLVAAEARSVGQVLSDRTGLVVGWAGGPDLAHPTSMAVFDPNGGPARRIDRPTGDWWWGNSDIRLGHLDRAARRSGARPGRFPGLYETDLNT